LRPTRHVQPKPFRKEAQAWVSKSAEDEEGKSDVVKEEVEEEEYFESLGDVFNYVTGTCMIISRLLLLGLWDIRLGLSLT
jgi:hypothetical protein